MYNIVFKITVVFATKLFATVMFEGLNFIQMWKTFVRSYHFHTLSGLSPYN